MLIGEVSERCGVSARMLRHYDEIGLVTPSARTPNGYRQYTESDIRRLFHVEGLRTLGLSLREITAALGDSSFSPTEMVEELLARTRERIAQEERLLQKLSHVQASDPADWSEVLRTIGLMRWLQAETPSQRQRVALSLGGSGRRDIVPLVEASLTETHPHVADTLDWAVAQRGDDAVPLLVEALASPTEHRRHRAVEVLKKIDSPQASAALADAFRSHDPVVSCQATLLRGRLGKEDAIPALVALVAAGDDDVDAADVLGTLAAGAGLADRIVDLLRDELRRGDAPTRLRLTSALAEIPGPSAQTVLAQLAGDQDRRVSLTASSLLLLR